LPYLYGTVENPVAAVSVEEGHLVFRGTVDLSWELDGPSDEQVWIERVTLDRYEDQAAAVTVLKCPEAFPQPGYHPTPMTCSFLATSTAVPADVRAWLDDSPVFPVVTFYVTGYDAEVTRNTAGVQLCVSYEGAFFGCGLD
jgi:hypothetical protein